MNKMIAITIRPGATTAAARLICPFACKSPPPAATRTSAKVPSSSENSRRHSRRGSSKSLRSPNSSESMWCVRRNAVPSGRRVERLRRCAAHAARPLCGPGLPRTIRPAHGHVVCHAPVLPVNSTHDASLRGRKLRAHLRLRNRNWAPSILSPPHDRHKSSGPVSFLIFPARPAGQGPKGPIAEPVRGKRALGRKGLFRGDGRVTAGSVARRLRPVGLTTSRPS